MRYPFQGPYEEPYLLVRSKSEIQAIDLKTREKTVVIGGLEKGRVMATDTVEMKLYFQEGNRVRRVNIIEEMCEEVFLQNTTVLDMAIDWMGRRIFWIENGTKQILVTPVDGKYKTVLINTTTEPYAIAVDPIEW